MAQNNVIPVYNEKNDDFMNKNSFDDYVSSSLYDDDFGKGRYNVMDDHLSRIEKSTEDGRETEIEENLLDEKLF